VERALVAGEGKLASNGALMCLTGDRTGRSPKDKYLEDTRTIHAKIWWGKVNQPIKPEQFDSRYKIAVEHLNTSPKLYTFEGFAGADPKHRLGVRVVTEQAWHSLFASTLFIKTRAPRPREAAPTGSTTGPSSTPARRLTAEEQKAKLGVKSPVLIAQSLEPQDRRHPRHRVRRRDEEEHLLRHELRHARVGVFPMHCSANVAKKRPSNVALFFGLSGTGKTTLSADPERALIGDDEHGWGPAASSTSRAAATPSASSSPRRASPQIWNAIRFGSVLENTDHRPRHPRPRLRHVQVTENTRVTYPVDFIPGAVIPSVGGHPKNVIFLTADAFGVMPARLQAQPRAGDVLLHQRLHLQARRHRGRRHRAPAQLLPCFGGVFLPRPPDRVRQDARRAHRQARRQCLAAQHRLDRRPYGVGSRFKLSYTRAMVTAILNGSLAKAPSRPTRSSACPPSAVPGVPNDVLNPRNTWKDGAAYDAQAKKLAKLFRENDAKFEMPDAVRKAGPAREKNVAASSTANPRSFNPFPSPSGSNTKHLDRTSAERVAVWPVPWPSSTYVMVSAVVVPSAMVVWCATFTVTLSFRGPDGVMTNRRILVPDITIPRGILTPFGVTTLTATA
jgi:phosphoenolpyruvate carboxykinase (ATP)